MHHDLPTVAASGFRTARLVDASLADGRGATAPTAERLDILLALDDLGIDAALIGYPAARPADLALLEASRARCRQLTRMVCTALADAPVLADLLGRGGPTENGPPIEVVLECGTDPRLAEGADPVALLTGAIIRLAPRAPVWVELAAIAAAAPEMLRSLVHAALAAGARGLILADTTGRMLPAETAATIGMLRAITGPAIPVIVAPADDLGLATANALAGLAAGADGVLGAIGGLGERAGLVPIEEVATAIRYRPDHVRLDHAIDLAALVRTGMTIADRLSVDLGRNKALLGDYVFGTAAGLHQHGLLNHPITYEYLDPADFGRERRILIGRHSGRAVLRARLTEAGINLDPAGLEAVYQAVMRSADPERFNDTAELVALHRRLSAGDAVAGPVAHVSQGA